MVKFLNASIYQFIFYKTEIIGVLAFNLVTRDEEVSENIKGRIKSKFSPVYNITSDEDVNEVLICPLNQNLPAPANSKSDEKWLNDYIDELKKLSLVT